MKAQGRGNRPAPATTPEEAFLQAIHANITDPAPWQMYADWLEERGDPNAVLYRERQSTNALGMEFVTVPAGTFWMGGGGGKAGKEPRTVAAFQIGIYPVTQGQWQAVMGSNPSWFSRSERGKHKVKNISDADLEQFPVECVSWNDAHELIWKLNEPEWDSGWLYCLPTEAEWEYACRGAAASEEDCSFHFYFDDGPTNDLSSDHANFDGNDPDGKAGKGRYLKRTAKIGSYCPNELGIFDMHGNVWEWCEDCEGAMCRVIRGGSWGDRGSGCQASTRGACFPAFHHNRISFRLARSSFR